MLGSRSDLLWTNASVKRRCDVAVLDFQFSFSLIMKYHTKKENGGVNPNRCTMFELTHVHNSEKPHEPNSKQAIALMKDKINKMKTTKRASQLPEVLNDFEINEVYASVLGKETRGGVRGFVIGVRPEQVPGVQCRKEVFI